MSGHFKLRHKTKMQKKARRSDRKHIPTVRAFPLTPLPTRGETASVPTGRGSITERSNPIHGEHRNQ